MLKTEKTTFIFRFGVFLAVILDLVWKTCLGDSAAFYNNCLKVL